MSKPKKEQHIKLYKPNRAAIKRQERAMRNKSRWDKEEDHMKRLQEEHLKKRV